MPQPNATSPDRRVVIASAAALAAGALVPFTRSARAAELSAQYQAARAELLAGRSVAADLIELDIPRLAESGNSVPMKVSVRMPITPVRYVKTIHILSEQNPIAVIARFHLGPRSGRAEVATNIRLATTQNVHAIAETNDGKLYEATGEVVVALAACLDGT